MKKETIFFVSLYSLFIVICTSAVLADTATTQASIGNAQPQASSVEIADGNLDGGEISLTSNKTTQINITATITDNNGCTDLTKVNATLFRTNLTNSADSNSDNRSHYTMNCTVQSSSCTGDTDLASVYDCKVNVTWYADPTDTGSRFSQTNWTVNVTPYDGDGVGIGAISIYELKTLTSFSLQSINVNFGTLALGQNTTTTNQNISIANLGNEAIDLSLTGYGSTTGDNLSMACSLGNITISYLEYNNTAFTYGAGINLSNTTTELDFDLDRGSEASARPELPVFFGFRIPSQGVGGSCSGNLVVTATSDPNID